MPVDASAVKSLENGGFIVILVRGGVYPNQSKLSPYRPDMMHNNSLLYLSTQLRFAFQLSVQYTATRYSTSAPHHYKNVDFILQAIKLYARSGRRAGWLDPTTQGWPDHQGNRHLGFDLWPCMPAASLPVRWGAAIYCLFWPSNMNVLPACVIGFLLLEVWQMRHNMLWVYKMPSFQSLLYIA